MNDVNSTQELNNLLSYANQTKVSAQELRQAYAKAISKNKSYKQHAQDVLNMTNNKAIFKPQNYKPYHEIKVSTLQQNIADCATDMAILNNELENTCISYASLINNTITRLALVEKEVQESKERINDINHISALFNDINNVTRIDVNRLQGSYSVSDNNVITAHAVAMKAIPLEAISVQGNGFAGNKYVLADVRNKFNLLSTATDDLSFLTDDNSMTNFEYSRLCMKNEQATNLPDANIDDLPARCTISFNAKQPVNSVYINSNLSNLQINDVLVSNDGGATYYSAFNVSQILNGDIYNTQENDANVICFPETDTFKIIFESNASKKNEKLGRKSAISDNIIYMDNVVRKVISINSIKCFQATFEAQSTFITDNLVDGSKLQAIGIFAKQYVPDYFKDGTDYITYTLIVNGQEHKIVPVNFDKDGTKLIKYMTTKYEDKAIKYIKEPIQTAQLKVTIKTYNKNATPYLSSLKLCKEAIS